MPDTIRQQKSALRNELRRQRRALPDSQQRQTALCIAGRLLRWSIVRRSRRVAVYLAQDGEVSLQAFVRMARRAGKSLYVPAVTGTGQLEFRRWRPGAKLRPGRLGTLELRPDAPRLPPEKLDLVLTPLVGFDLRGNRLGMGGGCYDRCFSRLGRGPQRVGVAHSLQGRPCIPGEERDQPLHAVVTEKGIKRF